MFTGIVEELGCVRTVTETARGLLIRIDAVRVRDSLRIGDSIAIDGVCQTVVELDSAGFAVTAIGTTLSRTTLGSLQAGVRVNLERALALGERLGGHLVQGHVDGTGRVTGIGHVGEHVLLDVSLPADVAGITVLHGSIAIHGVSLTVNELLPDDGVQVALIPHTWEHTNLRHLGVGDRVNIEGDMIGRFVAHLLRRTGWPGGRE